jgi:hypothetical protein
VIIIDTLAAACAEAGDWNNAIEWQEQTVEMATDEKSKTTERDHLELYKAKKPCRHQPKGVKV